MTAEAGDRGLRAPVAGDSAAVGGRRAAEAAARPAPPAPAGPSFDRSLARFFRQALAVGWREPRSASVFARAALRQRAAAAKRRRWARRGVQVPPLLIVSVTHRCNLRCAGCFVHAQYHPATAEMSADDLRRVLTEAVELGVAVVALAGGEPLMRPELLDVAAEFPELVFLLVSNGSLLDDHALATLEHHRHIVPVISVEGLESDTDGRRGAGVFARATAAMEEMRKRRLFFGASIMVTRRNFGLVTSRLFARDLVARGCRLFFYVDYVPVQVAGEPLVPTERQRQAERLMTQLLAREFPALFVASSSSEEAFGGCLAAGRGFAHVNPDGGLEPCPFSPYSDANVRDGGLGAALQSRLLREIRESDVHLSEAGGGCALWTRRDWLEGLLEPAPTGGDTGTHRLVA